MARQTKRKGALSLGTILLIVLILMLVGVLPTWPHSANWGYAPSGGLGGQGGPVHVGSGPSAMVMLLYR